jgi:TRAP-type mannitol/chloroaromatic compound transport system permease small subunit
MSQQQTQGSTSPVVIPEAGAAPASYQESGAGAGWVFFAAIMLVIGGVLGALQGLAAIIKSGYYAIPPNYYISINAKGWGWTHLILGLVVVLAGFALFRGAMWARILGIIIAGVSLIVNFAFIPVYPFWAMLIIAVDVLVIWALAAHGRVLAE